MKLITKEISLNDAKIPEWANEALKKYGVEKSESFLVRKGLVTDDVKFADGERASIDYITTKSIDRDGDIVLPQGAILDDYRKQPVVLWAHNYSSLPLGKNLWIKSDENGLIAKTQYASKEANPFADQVWNFRKEGFPIAKSIGFVPLSWIDQDDFDEVDFKAFGLNKRTAMKAKRIYDKYLILEYSDCPVQSNPDAIQIAIAKGIFNKDDVKDNFDLEALKEINLEEIEVNKESKEIDPGEEITFTPSEDGEIPEVSEKEFEEVKDAIKDTFEIDSGKKDANPENTEEKDIDLDKIIEEELEIAQKEVKAEENKEKSEEIEDEVLRISTLFKSFKIKEVTDENREFVSKQLDNGFDITSVKVEPYGFEYKIFCKYLGCKIKDIFVTDFFIPSPMKGNYLSAFKNVFAPHTLLEERNFTMGGNEVPLRSSVIQLKADLQEEFLTEGTSFYKSEDGEKFIFQIYRGWGGLGIDIYSHKDGAEFNKSLTKDAVNWVENNNLLKGEKFSISGEFLEKTGVDWDDVVFPTAKDEKTIKSNAERISKNSGSRGIMFIGPAGTGKTRTGRILMEKTDTTFIWASSKDFTYGANSALSMGFEMARKLAPSVFFLEDIDSWMNGYTVDLLKTEMDGIRDNKGVLTVLTSNFPEDIPDALIDRPGRFHHIVNFSLPNMENRMKMLNKWVEGVDKESLEKFAEITDGFSGAHMKELVDFAKIIAEDESIDLGKALIKSFDQMKEQHELISTVRNNKKKSLDINVEQKTIDLESIEIEDKVKDETKSLEIDIEEVSKEQLGDLIKDAVQDIVSKDTDIDLSQIASDAVKKVKGVIF